MRRCGGEGRRAGGARASDETDAARADVKAAEVPEEARAAAPPGSPPQLLARVQRLPRWLQRDNGTSTPWDRGIPATITALQVLTAEITHARVQTHRQASTDRKKQERVDRRTAHGERAERRRLRRDAYATIQARAWGNQQRLRSRRWAAATAIQVGFRAHRRWIENRTEYFWGGIGRSGRLGRWPGRIGRLGEPGPRPDSVGGRRWQALITGGHGTGIVQPDPPADPDPTLHPDGDPESDIETDSDLGLDSGMGLDETTAEVKTSQNRAKSERLNKYRVAREGKKKRPGTVYL